MVESKDVIPDCVKKEMLKTAYEKGDNFNKEEQKLALSKSFGTCKPSEDLSFAVASRVSGAKGPLGQPKSIGSPCQVAMGSGWKRCILTGEVSYKKIKITLSEPPYNTMWVRKDRVKGYSDFRTEEQELQNALGKIRKKIIDFEKARIRSDASIFKQGIAKAKESKQRSIFFRQYRPLEKLREVTKTRGKLSSSNISGMEYSEGMLKVSFNWEGKGEVEYGYDVGPDFYDRMAKSQSKGKFLWTELRGKMPGYVIDNPRKMTPGGVGGSIVPYTKLTKRAIQGDEFKKLQKQYAGQLKGKVKVVANMPFVRQKQKIISRQSKPYKGTATANDFYWFKISDLSDDVRWCVPTMSLEDYPVREHTRGGKSVKSHKRGENIEKLKLALNQLNEAEKERKLNSAQKRRRTELKNRLKKAQEPRIPKPEKKVKKEPVVKKEPSFGEMQQRAAQLEHLSPIMRSSGNIATAERYEKELAILESKLRKASFQATRTPDPVLSNPIENEVMVLKQKGMHTKQELQVWLMSNAALTDIPKYMSAWDKVKMIPKEDAIPIKGHMRNGKWVEAHDRIGNKAEVLKKKIKSQGLQPTKYKEPKKEEKKSKKREPAQISEEKRRKEIDKQARGTKATPAPEPREEAIQKLIEETGMERKHAEERIAKLMGLSPEQAKKKAEVKAHEIKFKAQNKELGEKLVALNQINTKLDIVSLKNIISLFVKAFTLMATQKDPMTYLKLFHGHYKKLKRDKNMVVKQKEELLSGIDKIYKELAALSKQKREAGDFSVKTHFRKGKMVEQHERDDKKKQKHFGKVEYKYLKTRVAELGKTLKSLKKKAEAGDKEAEKNYSILLKYQNKLSNDKWKAEGKKLFGDNTTIEDFEYISAAVDTCAKRAIAKAGGKGNYNSEVANCIRLIGISRRQAGLAPRPSGTQREERRGARRGRASTRPERRVERQQRSEEARRRVAVAEREASRAREVGAIIINRFRENAQRLSASIAVNDFRAARERITNLYDEMEQIRNPATKGTVRSILDDQARRLERAITESNAAVLSRIRTRGNTFRHYIEGGTLEDAARELSAANSESNRVFEDEYSIRRANALVFEMQQKYDERAEREAGAERIREINRQRDERQAEDQDELQHQAAMREARAAEREIRNMNDPVRALEFLNNAREHVNGIIDPEKRSYAQRTIDGVQNIIDAHNQEAENETRAFEREQREQAAQLGESSEDRQRAAAEAEHQHIIQERAEQAQAVIMSPEVQHRRQLARERRIRHLRERGRINAESNVSGLSEPEGGSVQHIEIPRPMHYISETERAPVPQGMEVSRRGHMRTHSVSGRRFWVSPSYRPSGSGVAQRVARRTSYSRRSRSSGRSESETQHAERSRRRSRGGPRIRWGLKVRVGSRYFNTLDDIQRSDLQRGDRINLSVRAKKDYDFENPDYDPSKPERGGNRRRIIIRKGADVGGADFAVKHHPSTGLYLYLDLLKIRDATHRGRGASQVALNPATLMADRLGLVVGGSPSPLDRSMEVAPSHLTEREKQLWRRNNSGDLDNMYRAWGGERNYEYGGSMARFPQTERVVGSSADLKKRFDQIPKLIFYYYPENILEAGGEFFYYDPDKDMYYHLKYKGD